MSESESLTQSAHELSGRRPQKPKVAVKQEVKQDLTLIGGPMQSYEDTIVYLINFWRNNKPKLEEKKHE